MKMVQVNGPALEAAIKAIGGEDGFRMVEQAYGVLNAYEQQVRESLRVDEEAVYRSGFCDGYECGRDVILGSEQPELGRPLPPVICLPDESEPELPFE